MRALKLWLFRLGYWRLRRLLRYPETRWLPTMSRHAWSARFPRSGPARRSGSRWNSTSAMAGIPIGAIRAIPAKPTKLAWQLPPGFAAGDIVWTTPHRFEIAPLVNYGYAKHAVHLVQITAPKDLKAGAPVSLAAKASWLVCSDVCIPGRRRSAVDPAGERPGRRHRSRPRPRCSRPRGASCPVRNRRRPALESRAISCHHAGTRLGRHPVANQVAGLLSL